MCAKVNIDRKARLLTGLLLLLAVVFSACSEHDVETQAPVDPVVVEDDGPIELAFACMPASHAMTRLASDIVQSGTSYRAINTTDMHFVALKKNGSGVITSVSNSEVDKQESVDKTNSRYYHFSYCDMPLGVNGCLVYAKAEDVKKNDEEIEYSVLEKKAINGCLTESPYLSNYVYSTDQITFEPVSIYPDETTIPTDAQTLADALTDIANTTYSGRKWSQPNDINNTDLKQLFSHFINYGYDLPGSAASVREWVKAVKDAAGSWKFGDGETDEFIRKSIISKAEDLLNKDKDGNIVNMTYPQDINLPDGAAVLRWTEVEEGGVKVKKFVPQLQTTTLDDINSVSRFVYPSALYYYVNSDIWTSNVLRKFDDYKGKSSWKGTDENAVQTLFSDDGTISTSTKTVAIADPLQYAVAQLKLQVVVDDEADDTELKFNKDATNTIPYRKNDDYYFRLTGVIIGGQRKVGYDFIPINNSDMDVKFVYDSQVSSDFYLKKGSTDVFNTLVLQSYDGEDLNIILEFEYVGKVDQNGEQVAQEFQCLNGHVYPGTRFYLVGEVKAKDFVPATGDATSQGRVFTQDYTTTIVATVKSLEKAYNVLPSILAKNLEIGVMTSPQWKAATPSSPVIMD